VNALVRERALADLVADLEIALEVVEATKTRVRSHASRARWSETATAIDAAIRTLDDVRLSRRGRNGNGHD
jgi:hypothetical protein